MSVNANLPIVIAAMGHVQRAVHNELAHPEAQQALAQQAAANKLEQAKSQVEKTNESEPSKLRADKDGGGGAQHQAAHDRKQKHGEEEPAPDSKGPWQGNIVDISV